MNDQLALTKFEPAISADKRPPGTGNELKTGLLCVCDVLSPVEFEFLILNS
jgi:hypothetical protein